MILYWCSEKKQLTTNKQRVFTNTSWHYMALRLPSHLTADIFCTENQFTNQSPSSIQTGCMFTGCSFQTEVMSWGHELTYPKHLFISWPLWICREQRKSPGRLPFIFCSAIFISSKQAGSVSKKEEQQHKKKPWCTQSWTTGASDQMHILQPFPLPLLVLMLIIMWT